MACADIFSMVCANIEEVQDAVAAAKTEAAGYRSALVAAAKNHAEVERKRKAKLAGGGAGMAYCSSHSLA
jgi:hypothetical protein